MVETIMESRLIGLDGEAERGSATLHRVTTDVALALARNELVLLIVPAYAHRPFADACADHLQPDQVLTFAAR